MNRMFAEIPRIEGARIVLRRLGEADAAPLARLAHSAAVYRYLPTFLYEQKYPDIDRVIRGLYTECIRESMILGVFLREDGRFCGLAQNQLHRAPAGVGKSLRQLHGLPERLGRKQSGGQIVRGDRLARGSADAAYAGLGRFRAQDDDAGAAGRELLPVGETGNDSQRNDNSADHDTISSAFLIQSYYITRNLDCQGRGVQEILSDPA